MIKELKFSSGWLQSNDDFDERVKIVLDLFLRQLEKRLGILRHSQLVATDLILITYKQVLAQFV